MQTYSTRQAAARLNLSWITLQRYISKKLIPAPPVRRIGGVRFREWTGRDIQKVRKLLPKIKNGRRRRRRAR